MLPTLYSKDKKGNIQEWDVAVIDNKIQVTYGKQGGKKVTKEMAVSPKNIGRSNETTIEEQCILEAKSLWTKQKERKGYVEDISHYNTTFLPMLAKSLRNNEGSFLRVIGKYSGGIILQRKYNGVRAFYEGCKFWSRRRVEYKKITLSDTPFGTVVQLCSEILNTPVEDIILDGEFYKHGMKLEDIQSAVKTKTYAELFDMGIDFHIFDVYVSSMPHLTYKERHDALCKTGWNLVIPYETIFLDIVNTIWEYEKRYKEEGYEGVMVKLDLPYEPNTRSSYMWKAKSFEDAEATIVGVKRVEDFTIIEDGVEIRRLPQGKFMCRENDGTEFDCMMKGTVEDRAQFILYPERYVGKILNFTFQERSGDGVPIFPVGNYFRED